MVSITIRPSGRPNSLAATQPPARAIAISVSIASLCSSIGAVSYQRNGRTLHVAALGADHRVQPQPHFVGAFGGDQQHTALPLYDMAKEGLTAPQRGRQIQTRRKFCRRPIVR